MDYVAVSCCNERSVDLHVNEALAAYVTSTGRACDSACVGIYGIQIYITGVSEHSGQESAIHNLYKLVSVVILVLVVNFKNYPLQHL